MVLSVHPTVPDHPLSLRLKVARKKRFRTAHGVFLGFAVGSNTLLLASGIVKVMLRARVQHKLDSVAIALAGFIQRLADLRRNFFIVCANGQEHRRIGAISLLVMVLQTATGIESYGRAKTGFRRWVLHARRVAGHG